MQSWIHFQHESSPLIYNIFASASLNFLRFTSHLVLHWIIPFSIGGSSKRHYKTVECWGADKPFANITENNLTAKSIALTVNDVLASHQKRHTIVTERFTYLDKLVNLDIVIWFWAQVNFLILPQMPQKWHFLQKRSKMTEK